MHISHGLKETDSVLSLLTQFINFVILTDVVAQYNQFTSVLIVIRTFGISYIEAISSLHTNVNNIHCFFVYC